MAAPRTTGLYPALLKYWRGKRGMSQLDLALTASVSSRHISFLETGRSHPSVEMALCLATAMDLPMRAKNEMLTSAGYEPRYRESSVEDGSLDSGVQKALDLILERHEPFPILVMDGRFDIVRMNRSAQRFLDCVCADPSALGDTPNGCEVFLHPDLAKDSIRDWPEVAALLVGYLHRNVLRHPDNRALAELLDQMLTLPDVALQTPFPEPATPATGIFTFHFESNLFEGAFLTTLTTFIAPNDITLEELSIESYYPLDEATTQECHRTLAVPC